MWHLINRAAIVLPPVISLLITAVELARALRSLRSRKSDR